MSERQPGSIGRSAPHTIHVLPHSESVIPRFLGPALDRVSADADATQLLVISADADFNRGVSPAEFRHTAGQRFLLIDRNHDGRISHDELSPPPEERGRR